MFCIYGRSRVAASKYIDKKLLNKNSEISKELKESLSQVEKQLILDRYIDKYFKVIPIRKCSHELSTPELARQLFKLMKKEVYFSELKLMKKQPKLLKSGKESESKSTGRILMEWVDMTNN